MDGAGHVVENPSPAFCRVAATLRPTSDSDIGVEVWLPPSGWSGNLLGIGNFGWAGSHMPGGMLSGIAWGYATARTDTGHGGQGGRFALRPPEKLIDHDNQADHLMTVDAEVIIRRFHRPLRSIRTGSAARWAAWNS